MFEDTLSNRAYAEVLFYYADSGCSGLPTIMVQADQLLSLAGRLSTAPG